MQSVTGRVGAWVTQWRFSNGYHFKSMHYFVNIQWQSCRWHNYIYKVVEHETPTGQTCNHSLSQRIAKLSSSRFLQILQNFRLKWPGSDQQWATGFWKRRGAYIRTARTNTDRTSRTIRWDPGHTLVGHQVTPMVDHSSSLTRASDP